MEVYRCRFTVWRCLPTRTHSPLGDDPDAPLGILSCLENTTFVGDGLNMLFRPNNGTSANTKFPIPVDPAPPTFPNNNTLEINLFKETLTFGKALGQVPNRGSQQQGDVNLNALPYLQTITDTTNDDTGRGDKTDGPGIHAENGMFLHVPATINNPNMATTITRLGSIPHGVAINLHGFEPTASSTVFGPPDITHNPCLTTPFQTIGTTTNLQPFDSLKVENKVTARIPQNLDKFAEQGTITDVYLDDRTHLLTDVNKTRNITKTITLTMSTTNLTNSSKPTDVPAGGGLVANAFLDGDVGGKPNAFQGGGPVEVFHEGIKFVVHPPREIPEPTTVKVSVIELQYSQMVMLQFGVLTWPHPSVSTLKPEVVNVLANHEAWKGL
ncbi:hypothetical protein QBC35DRAFT_517579 [Podospora australis]|uniref:Uncharacterized protein n=1 Tax=Podospora australis TaxID=1536484 RepID=A0AAN6WM92_9PEZI|nr:hypothetical protein QBC35DRAFT_517579 [Podospora australis]